MAKVGHRNDYIFETEMYSIICTTWCINHITVAQRTITVIIRIYFWTKAREKVQNYSTWWHQQYEDDIKPGWKSIQSLDWLDFKNVE